MKGFIFPLTIEKKLPNIPHITTYDVTEYQRSWKEWSDDERKQRIPLLFCTPNLNVDGYDDDDDADVSDNMCCLEIGFVFLECAIFSKRKEMWLQIFGDKCKSFLW